jgi:hypothetical protein
MIDPRQPRFGQAITGLVLLIGYLTSFPPAIAAIAVVLAAASLGGPRFNPYAHLYRWFARMVRLGPPTELEEAAPPRFANTVGFVVTTVASALAAVGLTTAAWVLALVVSALALLAAATGLCVGCELYVLGRRVLAGGPRSIQQSETRG